MNASKTQGGNRWLQFRLRSLVLLVAVGGPLLGWIGYQWFAATGDFYANVDYATFVPVCGINPDDAAQVARLLDDNRIPNIVEGSKIFGVSVPPRHREEALRLIAEDAKRSGYWFMLAE